MYSREYQALDALALARLVKRKEVSPQELLNCALSRLDEANPALNAVVTDCVQFAEQQIKQLSGDEPLAGVPLLVKDLGFAIKGIRDTSGSHFFQDQKSPDHSDFIKKMLALGLIPFAKTNTAEFGLSYVTEPALFGPCRNPLDLTRTAGGSSGGSAAAVAAGIAPVATASDGGGSIRVPAACCGLFGLKPSTGLMPTGPWVAESWSGLASPHVLTRSIEDSRFLFEQLTAERLPFKPDTLPKTLKIVQLQGAFAPVQVDPVYSQAITRMSELLQQMGYSVDTIDFPLNQEEIAKVMLPLIAANTAAVIEYGQHLFGRKVHQEEIEPISWEFYQMGLKIKGTEVIMAKNRLYYLMQPVRTLFQQVDLVLSPALAKLPLKIGELSTQDSFDSYVQKNAAFSPFTSLFNQSGLPAMSLPVLNHNNLSVSVQFASGFGREGLLYALAEALQARIGDLNFKLAV